MATQMTSDDRKIESTAPFNEDGKKQIVDWVNLQYETYKDQWSTKKL